MTRVSWRDILRASQGQAERRDTLRAPSQQLVTALGADGLLSSPSVNPDTALAHSDAYACVRVLADAVGSLPLIVYRRTSGGREREMASPTARLLQRPSPALTQQALMSMVTAHLQGWGNAFIGKFRDERGQVVQLGAIHPRRVSVALSAGEPVFTVQPETSGPVLTLTRRDVIHVKAMSVDGLVGLSPVAQARRALGVAISLEDQAANLLENDSRPGGVLKSDRTLSEQAARRLKDAWRAWTSGTNRGATVVLEEGLSYQAVTLSPADSQFIEQAKLSATRVARVFRVPPYMIGADNGSSMTYSNVEQESASFVMHSLRPWLVCIEQALAADEDLFPQQGDTYPEFLVDALLRADTATRFEAYGKAVGVFMTVNEIRRRENLNDLPGGDDLSAGVSEEVRSLEAAGLAGLAVQRLGLGVNYGVLSEEESRRWIPGLDPAAVPVRTSPQTPPQEVPA